MPFSVMGCGTMLCGGRGFVKWPKSDEPDSDAVEAMCLFSVPLLPVGAVHASSCEIKPSALDPVSTTYQRLPIQSSWKLFLKALIHRVWYVFFLIGLTFIGVGIAVMVNPPDPAQLKRMDGPKAPSAEVIFIIGTILALIGIVPFVVIMKQDRRDQGIRWLLGRREYALGSSDPATWIKKYKSQVLPAGQLFDKSTYYEAASHFHQAQQYEPAMLAARLSVALEDAQKGEELTDSILQDPKVIDAIARIRKKPKLRAEVLVSEKTWNAESIFVAEFIEKIAKK
jgi:hypothetical protein